MKTYTGTITTTYTVQAPTAARAEKMLKSVATSQQITSMKSLDGVTATATGSKPTKPKLKR